jgi:hypothetical protein
MLWMSPAGPLQHDDASSPTTLGYATSVRRRRAWIGVVIPAAAVHFAVLIGVWQFVSIRMGWQAEVMGSRTAVDHAADVVLAAHRTSAHVRAHPGAKRMAGGCCEQLVLGFGAVARSLHVRAISSC